MCKRSTPEPIDHGLELLLDYDGRLEFLPGGYFLKFVIRRVPYTTARPHGVMYSFTLHDPHRRRILGFDNAHAVSGAGIRSMGREGFDHWHRTADDPGRPYPFTSAADLLRDFYDAVAETMRTRGFPLEIVDETNSE